MSADNKQWRAVCSTQDLVENAGVCVLIHEDSDAEQQVALFKVASQQVFAIGNYDPLGKANVLYRGIVGSVGDDAVVASPLYKQHYSLTSGECKEDNTVRVPAYETRIVNNSVELFC